MPRHRPWGDRRTDGPDPAELLCAVPALEHLGARTLLLSPALTPVELGHILPTAGCGCVIGPHSAALEEFGAGTQIVSPADAGSVLLTTSGTTGLPKIVVRTRPQLAALARAYCATIGISSSDRILCMVPLMHGQGLCAGLLAALWTGASLFVEPVFDRRRILATLQEQAISIAVGVPFQYGILASTVRDSGFRAPSLRYAFSGGSPLFEKTWRQVRERSGISIRQTYGCSETGMLTANLDTDPESAIESVGTPLQGMAVRIDPASGAIEAHSPAASAPPGEWVLTGDAGRVDALGRVWVIGRREYLLNIAGRKVNPAEIERVLLLHPLVESARVKPITRESGEEACMAVVSCTVPCSPEELFEFCRARLAAYKMPAVIRVSGSLPAV
ncbi:MAG: fatty acid--CoA ligase family protein [Bryobacteraceae bacterium]